MALSEKAKKIGDGSAFPHGVNAMNLSNHLGMTKREAFAMAAMQGLVAHYGNISAASYEKDFEALGRMSVERGDALLEHLAKD